MPYIQQVAVGRRDTVFGSDYPNKDGTGVATTFMWSTWRRARRR